MTIVMDMTITARYAAACSCCSVPIRPGDKIEWAKGSPARHAACQPRTTPSYMVQPTTTATRIAARMSTPDRRGGKWTGCSCGSRENSFGDLIASPRNCSSCRHDA